MMYLFYNISGSVIAILALLMLWVPSVSGEEGRQFNSVRRYLSAMFLLTSLSMFIAQFEARLPLGQFEKVDALMLLFFFLIGQGFIYSLLVLYASPYANRTYLKRVLSPALPLFGLYTVVYFFTGDVRVYSAAEFFTRLPSEFLLVLRCIILLVSTATIVYGLVLCHKAKDEYNRLIANYFSEDDFARSIWLSRLLSSAEALSLWVVLTYFYTTPILEMVVGTMIIALFVFYIREFYRYTQRYQTLRPAIVFSRDSVAGDEPRPGKQLPEMRGIHKRVQAWIGRADKPFTRAKLTVGDVARETGVPKHKLSQYVNSREDNFCTWINKLRVGEASRLLRNCPKQSITEIAEMTGFCDLPAFSRAFKKITGISPRAYRSDK